MNWTKLPLLIAPLLTLACAASVAADDNAFFAEKIEPLLKSHCLACHSHAAGEMEGGLTLDSRGGWAVGGSRGPAIIPGKPEESLLITAIRRGDKDLQMPPDDKLSDQQVALLVDWVKRGAPDPRQAQPAPTEQADPTDWWSLRPLKQPAVPQSSNSGSEVRNAIDAFVWQKLQASGLSFAPQADRRTLIRRLYFNLHGLPPTPAEVADFVADPDPLAYEKLVDELLNSPRYGERLARHWLDTIHFADSHGCEHDVLRTNAWRYRDYVIHSFNGDTSWGRFIREQLAADHFYADESHLQAALGFISAGPLELSRASTAPVTFDYLDRDDIVTQTMAAFASSTANCARCHNHKFDPITQEDYYSLQAVFAAGGKGDIEFDSDPAVAGSRRHWQELLTACQNNTPAVVRDPQYADIVAKWEDDLQQHSAIWEPLIPETFVTSDGTILQRLADNSLLATGTRPDKDIYTVTARLPLKQLTALRLEVLADDSLPMQGPGRCDNGNLHLNEFEAFVFDEESKEPRRLKIHQATADWNQASWTIAHALDGNIGTAWGIFPKVGQSHHAVFELEQPVTLTSTSRLVVQLKQLHGGGHLIGRLKLYATTAANASATVLPESVRVALKLPSDQRLNEQQTAIAAYALQLHAKAELARLLAPVSVYGWSTDYSHGKKQAAPLPPKTVHVLKRGDIHKPGNEAVPGALSVVKALPARFDLETGNDDANRRAALANWLAAHDNPLTWRSIVNRTWCWNFGRGLCDTPNDFGKMGDMPSHLELLDWLAVWFRDDAQGSLKDLHRLILCSATWRQQSHIAAQPSTAASNTSPQSIDGQNRLLWRMNRRPLTAESFRDAVLHISGRIDLTMGGPGVQQFTQSKGQQLTPMLDYNAFDWNDAAAARRSIYRVVWRGIPDPFMESLDFPDLGLLSPKRGYSVSALQALAVFNNDFVLHHSQVLAERLQADQPTLDKQIMQAARLVFLRELNNDELALLVAYANKHGLAAMCRVLFNSNEFVFVD